MTEEQEFDSIELMETIQTSFNSMIRENPMGESKKDALRVNFDRKLKLEFHASESHQRCRFIDFSRSEPK